MPHRCAFGCKNTDVPMHVFPNPDKFPERFKIWIDLVGEKLEMPLNEFLKKKRICDIHFIPEHRNRNKRLNALAIPLLNLPGTSKSENSGDNQPGTSFAAADIIGSGVSIHQEPENSSDTQPGTSTAAAAFIAPGVSIHQEPENSSDTQPGTSTAAAAFIAPGVSIHQEPENSSDTQPGTSTAAAAFIAPGVSIHQEPENSSNTQPGTSTAAAAFSAPVSSIIQESEIRCDTQPGSSVLASGLQHHAVTAATVIKEHNYSVFSRPRPLVKGAPERTAVYKCMQMKPLQTKIKYLRSEICRLRKKGLSLTERLANAEKLTKDLAFQRVTKHMTKPTQLFIHMQLQSKKKAKGRRFSTEEKILCLSLFKKSPKCYRLLCNYFTLPSTKAMKRLLSEIKVSPGINPIIFERIKSTLRHKDTSDRMCSLIFDEMSITPQVNYNVHKDQLDGFAFNKENKFSDHALVFMVKGIKRNFKQPIAYYFTNSLNKIELKTMIKTVIQHCIESGLIVVCTVCDQSQVNVGAITELVNDTRASFLRQRKEWHSDIIRIKGQFIIPLYDTPHLIKGLRNNLITKDLIYYIGNEKKYIKWDYYQMVYLADKMYGELRLLNKLTEEHVNPDKINKMRVKFATQLFSHSVAVATNHLTASGDLPEECRQLIDFTILIDNLFDSLNVSSFSIPDGKIFKGPVRRNSPHHELWRNAKNILKTVKYVKKNKVGDKVQLTETVVPSVTNLIKTIEGMESLWKVLSNKYGLDTMLTRNFNQDPVENFFGNIRSYGARNIAPNSIAFEGAFKALMLNNFNSPHSRRANCEEDSNECLQTLDFFLKEKIVTPDVPEENERIHFDSEICLNENENDAGQSNYVCGWVIKKCLKSIVKGCQHCKLNLLDNTSSNTSNAYIKAKEYQNKNWLCYPNKETEKFFRDSQNIVCSFLKKNVPKKHLKQTMLSFIDMFVDCPFNCPKHKTSLKEMFLNTTVNVLICSWCRSVNRILSGKIIYNGEDEIKIAAQIYFNKHKHYKNRK